MEVFAVLCSLFAGETKCKTSIRSRGVTVYLAVHPRRIVLRVVVKDVTCQIRLKGRKTEGKRLMKVAQGGGVWADHNDTVLFGGAKIAAVGGLVWWGKDKRRDAHGHKVGPVLANVRRMRGSVASVGKASDSIEKCLMLGAVG